MKHRIKACGLALLFALSSTAFANTADVAPNATPDPYERYNRVMFKINSHADRYVLAPVARTYRKVVPQPARTAVGNVFNNLRDVVSFGSNVLRGNVKNAGHDFMRVALNTTFGLGGLIDLASEAGMPNNKNTLGDTFASWGWKDSHYLVLPLLGPSTVRDGVGSAITSLYAPERALLTRDLPYYSVSALKAVDQREQYLDLTENLGALALDEYSYMRDVYMPLRNKQVGNVQAQQQSAEDDFNIDDLVAPESGAADAEPAITE